MTCAEKSPLLIGQIETCLTYSRLCYRFVLTHRVMICNNVFNNHKTGPHYSLNGICKGIWETLQEVVS